MSVHEINGRIGALESWSRTPDRPARTAKARSQSPCSVEYHEDQIRAEGIVPEKDIPKAAEARHRAHMLRLSKASAAARRIRKGAA
jgi:hypothetical protein